MSVDALNGNVADSDNALMLQDASGNKLRLVAANDGLSVTLDGNTLATFKGAASGGILGGSGTSTTPTSTSTADQKFLSYYVKSTATSGDARGIYDRLYLAGAGGSGEAARLYTTISDIAAATARGAHISLDFASSGYITGLGAAMDATLHIPNAAMHAAGTYAAVSADINSDGASSDPTAVTELSFFRAALEGNATGVGKVDDKAYLFVLDGGTTGSGNIVEASTTEANYAYSIRCKINGVVMYLMAASAVG